jgi:glycerate dehydrogenase
MNNNKLVFLDAGSIGDDISWPEFSRFGEVVLYEYTEKEEIGERIKDADFVFTNKVAIRAEHIVAAPRLCYVGVLATGYNQVDLEASAQRGIPVCNVPDYSSPSVVQHVFTLLFALSSDICGLAASVRAGGWSKSRQFCYWNKPIIELRNKTMGIVGFGDIGSLVAEAAHCFGMKVLAYAPRPKKAPAYAPFSFVSLEDLFRQSDVVSLHCPLTPENTGMISASLLKIMKKSAFLINTARGPLINEPELAAALRDGVIAGAGLDVVSREPMPDDNPLREAPNCLITPHVAWSSVEARTRLMQGVFDNVQAFVNGKPSNVKNGL